jgi:hypothetical protein
MEGFQIFEDDKPKKPPSIVQLANWKYILEILSREIKDCDVDYDHVALDKMKDSITTELARMTNSWMASKDKEIV